MAVRFVQYVLVSVGVALMVWRRAVMISGIDTPVAVVVSSSMSPLYDRGDLIFVFRSDDAHYRPGLIILFRLSDKPHPIVHRIESVSVVNGEWRLVTRGDNNLVNDLALYERYHTHPYLVPSDVIGFVKPLVIPYIGQIAILRDENPLILVPIVILLVAYQIYSSE